MSLELVKKYLRIDEDADDDVLQIMMSAAEQYIVDAVGKYDPENFKAQLLFLAIVQDLYENRVLNVREADRQRMAYTFGSIVLQLQCDEMGGDADAG